MIPSQEVLKETEIIDFYRYTDVTKEGILSFLKSRSEYWSQPRDTGSCSSNCRVNDVGIYVQREQKEYDNYTFPNSWEVRLGHISLEQSKRELEEVVDEEKVEELMKEIGYEKPQGREDGKRNLADYYVTDEEIEENDIYEYLKERLPGYEMPSGIMRLEKIPITLNGKTDYRKLPKIGEKRYRRAVAYKDEIELKLAEIWSEIFKTSKFDREDNFLAIGGHSLNVMAMISRIQDCFLVELPLEIVFNNAQICRIADYIRSQTSQERRMLQPVLKKDYYTISS